MTSFAGTHSPPIQPIGADSRQSFSNETNTPLKKESIAQGAIRCKPWTGDERSAGQCGVYAAAASLCQRSLLCLAQIGRVINKRFMVCFIFLKGFFPEAVKFKGDTLTELADSVVAWVQLRYYYGRPC